MCEAASLGSILLASWMVSAYWFCLIVGGGLLLVSALGAGSHDGDVDVATDVDADFDVDVHVDVDTDLHVDTDHLHADHDAAHHGGVAGLSTWFSLRFVVFFVAVFGAVGVVFTHTTDILPGLTLALAIFGGLAVGQGVHHLFRMLRRSSGDSAPRPQDYVRKLARVTIPIVHPNKGEVALQVRNAKRYVPAVASGEVNEFGRGEEVVVVAYRAGVAQVVSQEEFEQQYASEQGGAS